MLAGGIVQPQIQQRLAGIVVGLAAGNQAQAVMRTFNDVVIQPIGPDVGQGGVPLVVEQASFLLQRMVRPADVQAAGRHLKVGGNLDLHPVRVNHGGGAGLHDFLDGLHAGPHAREPAHGKGMNAQVQNFLHRGREKNRCAAGLENMVALVRRRRAFGDVVVARHRNHPAPLGGAGHVGVLEHVAAAVHARALAIPDAEHAIKLVGAGRGKAELLCTPQGSGSQLFVDAGLENDVLGLEVFPGLDQRLVIPAQR